MTTLSVVVANVARDRATVERCIASIVEQLRPDDELIWVDSAGLACPWPDAVRVEEPDSTSRGRLYAAGLAQARHRMVAFTDSTTAFGAGWRACADTALTVSTITGGPVEPARPRTLRSWAGFFVEYGPHAVAPFTSATGDVAANDVVYDRGALEAVLAPGEAVWKTSVDARLRAAGHVPAVLEGLRVRVARTYTGTDLSGGRARAGRLYGAQRAAGWSVAPRALAALGCAALPALAYARLARRIRADPALRGPFLRSTPLILLALVCWSAGEARGYWSRAPGSDDVF